MGRYVEMADQKAGDTPEGKVLLVKFQMPKPCRMAPSLVITDSARKILTLLLKQVEE
jgi:hypothetical protein